MGEESEGGLGRVGSDFWSTIEGRVGSGRVNVLPGRVGSKKSDPWTTLSYGKNFVFFIEILNEIVPKLRSQ